MSGNGNKKVKGTVLYTVVSVMSILVVLVLASLTLAASANRRAHNNYANNQTQFTARSVIDIVWNKIDEMDDVVQKISYLNVSDGPKPIFVDGLDPSLGKIKEVSVKCVKDKTETEEKVYKLSVTVEMLGQESTVCAYYSMSKVEGRPLFNYGIRTYNNEMMSNAIALGGVCMGVDTPKGQNSTTNFQNANTKVNSPIHIKGDLSIQYPEMIILNQRSGMVVNGNISFNNAKGTVKSNVPRNSNIYRDLPYIFAYMHNNGSYGGGNITLEGDNQLNIGEHDSPILVIAQDIKQSSTAEQPIYGDVYLLGSDKISTISPVGVKSWDEDVLNKKIVNSAKVDATGAKTYKSYTGGNLYSLGTLDIKLKSSADNYLANNVVADVLITEVENNTASFRTGGAIVLSSAKIDDNTFINSASEPKGFFIDPDNLVCGDKMKINGEEYRKSFLESRSLYIGNYDNEEGLSSDNVWTSYSNDYKFEARDYHYTIKKSYFRKEGENYYKMSIFPTSVKLDLIERGDNPFGRNVSAGINVNANIRDVNVPVWGDTIASYGENKIHEVLNSALTLLFPYSRKLADESVLTMKLNDISGKTLDKDDDNFEIKVTQFNNPYKVDKDGKIYKEEDDGLVEVESGTVDIHSVRPIGIKANVTVNADIYTDNYNEVKAYLKKVNDIAFEKNGGVIQIDDIDKSVLLKKNGDTYSIYKIDLSAADFEEGTEGDLVFTDENLVASYGSSDDYADFLKKVVETACYPDSMSYYEIGYKKYQSWHGDLVGQRIPDMYGRDIGYGPFKGLKTLAHDIGGGGAYNEDKRMFVSYSDSKGFADDFFIQGVAGVRSNGINDVVSTVDKMFEVGDANDSNKPIVKTKKVEYNFDDGKKYETGKDPEEIKYPLTVTDDCTFKGASSGEITISPASDEIYIQLANFTLNYKMFVNDKTGKVNFLLPYKIGSAINSLNIKADILTEYYRDNSEIYTNPVVKRFDGTENGYLEAVEDMIPDIYFYGEYYQDKPANPEVPEEGKREIAKDDFGNFMYADAPNNKIPIYRLKSVDISERMTINLGNGNVVCGYFMIASGDILNDSGALSRKFTYHFDPVPLIDKGSGTLEDIDDPSILKINYGGDVDKDNYTAKSIIIGAVSCARINVTNQSMVAFVDPNPKNVNGGSLIGNRLRLQYYQAY